MKPVRLPELIVARPSIMLPNMDRKIIVKAKKRMHRSLSSMPIEVVSIQEYIVPLENGKFGQLKYEIAYRRKSKEFQNSDNEISKGCFTENQLRDKITTDQLTRGDLNHIQKCLRCKELRRKIMARYLPHTSLE